MTILRLPRKEDEAKIHRNNGSHRFGDDLQGFTSSGKTVKAIQIWTRQEENLQSVGLKLKAFGNWYLLHHPGVNLSDHSIITFFTLCFQQLPINMTKECQKFPTKCRKYEPVSDHSLSLLVLIVGSRKFTIDLINLMLYGQE